MLLVQTRALYVGTCHTCHMCTVSYAASVSVNPVTNHDPLMNAQDVINISKDAFDVFSCQYGTTSHGRVLEGLLEDLCVGERERERRCMHSSGKGELCLIISHAYASANNFNCRCLLTSTMILSMLTKFLSV